MRYLLFPGRHHLLTTFQREYLTAACAPDGGPLVDVDGHRIERSAPLDAIVWAVTSANHANTRRNPLPAHRREAAIEAFGRDLPAASFVYLIDDIGTSDRFAEYVLKKIEVDSRGRHALTPENCLIACSTPSVIALYERLGFQVLPCELVDRAAPSWSRPTPWQLLDRLVDVGLAGRDWRTDAILTREIAPATQRLYTKYHFDELIVDLHRSPLLTDDGDLTATRDYNTYVRAFDEGAARKAELVRDLVLPGRIVDVGCCTGAVLRELSRVDRLRESDLYGVEVARTLYSECQHRKEQGAFANDHVFFYHCDFAARPVFPPNSVNTFLTFSLTHEVESYAGRTALNRFLELLRDQLALGGRWINADVIGPEEPDELVWMSLCHSDGRNDDWTREFAPAERQALRDYLAGLSTYGRFLRFAQDFRREERYALPFELRVAGEARYAVLRLADACEFLSKKDYTDNWQSEMHETFCFWSLADWQAAVTAAGFVAQPCSRAYVNPWLVEHRYRGRAELWRPTPGGLVPRAYPPTHMVLVADRV